MYYDRVSSLYPLEGSIFEDRRTVQDALYSSKLSFEEKEQLVAAHNWRHCDFMTTDTYINGCMYDYNFR